MKKFFIFLSVTFILATLLGFKLVQNNVSAKNTSLTVPTEHAENSTISSAGGTAKNSSHEMQNNTNQRNLSENTNTDVKNTTENMETDTQKLKNNTTQRNISKNNTNYTDDKISQIRQRNTDNSNFELRDAYEKHNRRIRNNELEIENDNETNYRPINIYINNLIIKTSESEKRFMPLRERNKRNNEADNGNQTGEIIRLHDFTQHLNQDNNKDKAIKPFPITEPQPRTQAPVLKKYAQNNQNEKPTAATLEFDDNTMIRNAVTTITVTKTYNKDSNTAETYLEKFQSKTIAPDNNDKNITSLIYPASNNNYKTYEIIERIREVSSLTNAEHSSENNTITFAR